MSEQTTRQQSVPSTAPLRTGTSQGMSGWSGFAGIVMVVVGLFGVVQGLFALLRPTVYVLDSGAVVVAGIGAWAWVHLIVGALVALTGSTLLSGDLGATRSIAMGVVGLSALVQLVFLPAAPVWSILAIALDVLILVALAGTPERQRS